MKQVVFSHQYYHFLDTVPSLGLTIRQHCIDETQALVADTPLWACIQDNWKTLQAQFEHEICQGDEGVHLEIRLVIDDAVTPSFFSMAQKEAWEQWKHSRS